MAILMRTSPPASVSVRTRAVPSVSDPPRTAARNHVATHYIAATHTSNYSKTQHFSTQPFTTLFHIKNRSYHVALYHPDTRYKPMTQRCCNTHRRTQPFTTIFDTFLTSKAPELPVYHPDTRYKHITQQCCNTHERTQPFTTLFDTFLTSKALELPVYHPDTRYKHITQQCCNTHEMTQPFTTLFNVKTHFADI